MTFQAVCINAEMFFAAGLCIVMQHVRLPVIVTTLAHYGWIMVSGKFEYKKIYETIF